MPSYGEIWTDESICKSINLLLHFLEWVQNNMERLPVILNGTALHMFSKTKALRLEMWVSRINEKTGKQFCNERSDEFQTRRKKIKTLLIIEHKKWYNNEFLLFLNVSFAPQRYKHNLWYHSSNINLKKLSRTHNLQNTTSLWQ